MGSKIIVVLLSLTLLLCGAASALATGSISDTNKYVWSETGSSYYATLATAYSNAGGVWGRI